MALPSRFVKMAGGGNDFLVFEADGRRLSAEDLERVALLCRRGMSVGADGALFLSGGEGSRIRVDYFNADGGAASFCANGTRCAARYVVTRRMVSGLDAVLETGWAPIAARVGDGNGDSPEAVSLFLPALPKPGDAIPLVVSDPALPPQGTPMHVGVPHLVVSVPGELGRLDIAALGAPLRKEQPLLPQGANVDFVRVTGPDRLAIRTFERGVEGETLACGSGVVASAIVAARAGLVSSPVSVETKSGVVFTVSFTLGGDTITDAVLTGDVREIFAAELTAEAWQP